jgi:hypothetical protein
LFVCLSAEDSRQVRVVSSPGFAMEAAPSLALCSNQSKAAEDMEMELEMEMEIEIHLFIYLLFTCIYTYV